MFRRTDFDDTFLVISGDALTDIDLTAEPGEAHEGVALGVAVLGALDDADKVALLTLCYAVAFPSHLRSEAFGISLLEGAMYGKPMISSEIGTGTSYINIDGETGLVVPMATTNLFGDPVFRDGGLLAESVYRFKGQSAPAVIFTEVDFAEIDELVFRKLFVGMTRARLKLVLVLSERAAAQLLDRI